MGKSALTRTAVNPAAEPGESVDALFSRDEVLGGGLPGRRAHRLLYEIERRTARLSEQWQVLVALSSTADGMPGPAFLAAEVLDDANRAEDEEPFDGARWRRELPYRPTIRDIERHAVDWVTVVPNDTWAKAAIAQAIGRKYRFTEKSVPHLRAALALDEEATRTAFRRLYGRPLESIYAAVVPTAERVKWALAAPLALLNRLPPFWVAFLLLFLLPLPQAFLATPIAAADAGALGGIAILAIVGAINVLTVGYTAEATARSRSMRFGGAFVGRLGWDFLGPIGSAALTLSASLLFFLALVSSDIGLGRTVDDVTGIPAWLCSAVLLVACLALLLKGRQSMSLGVMLVLAAINVALVVAISLLSLTHLKIGNLDETSLFSGSFSASRLDQILGVAMMCFFGQALVPQASRVVLRRDPGGQALIRGSIAGTGCLVALVAVWTVAVSGALPPGVLAAGDGTVIGPLADEVGLGINALGTVLVISALGMTALRCALILSNLTLERLPSGEPREMELPRLRDRLRIAPRDWVDQGPIVGVTYLGLRSGVPCLGVDLQVDGELHNTDVTPTGRWRLDKLGDDFPSGRSRLPRVWIETVEAARDAIRLRLGTRSSVSYMLDRGLHPADLLTISGEGSAVLRFLHRHGDATSAEIAAGTGQSVEESLEALKELAAAGAVAVDDGPPQTYRVQFARKHGRDVPAVVWDALDETTPPKMVASAAAVWDRIAPVAFGTRGRLWLSLVPILVAFAVAAWIEYGTSLSYAHLLGFTGVIAVSVFGGVIPPLLLAASRRKGEVVVTDALRWFARPLVVGAISALFLVNLLLHGLIFWSGAEQVAAFVVFAALVVGIVAMLRRGLLATRLSVELRAGDDESANAAYEVVIGGTPVTASVRLIYESGEQTVEGSSGDIADVSTLRKATFRVPDSGAASMRVWAHRVGATGDSEALPAFVTVRNGGRVRRVDLELGGGQALVPLREGEVVAEFALAQAAT